MQIIRPWLGTLVRVAVAGVERDAAEAAIERAFGAVAAVHRTLGFHDPHSDLSRLNGLSAGQPGIVSPMLREVLEVAQELAALSDGVFDVTVGGELVRTGVLPRFAEVRSATEVDWRDLLLQADGAVAWRRAGLVDLGGIAKGYAVARAAAALALPVHARWCIEAGGDLRVGGDEVELVPLRVPDHPAATRPLVELQNGSLAASAIDRARGVHLDGRTRAPAQACEFAAVVAPCCLHADALTKLVIACGERSAPWLRRYGAVAHAYDVDAGWRTFGADTLAPDAPPARA